MTSSRRASARAQPSVGSVDPGAYRDAVRRGAASIATVRAAAAGCRACDLWQRATQTVFGSGARRARVVLIGEQPGDHEDRSGQPFVGPAGELLDRALAAAGIDRCAVYITNAVKHFSWEARGKWRIHKKPKPDQVRACRPWLEAEIYALRPQIVVCLGATAAQAILGAQFRVTRRRGEFLSSPLAPTVMATVHPAAILRAPDDPSRHAAMRSFIADLKKVGARLAVAGNG